MEARTTNQTGIISRTAQSVQSGTEPRKPANEIRTLLSTASIRKLFDDALKENAGAFVASIIDLYNSDTYLQACDPKLVIMEALKAAALKLPVSKQLGFAYIVPYKKGNEQIPQFQLGYKGYIQLSQRTGAYRYINAEAVYEGEFKGRDKLTGNVDMTGERTGDTIIGYFAYIETINGFCKTVYRSRDEIKAHAKRYSKSYSYSTSAWSTNFDEMAIKTVLRILLSHYGIMSVEFQTALEGEQNAEMADTQIGIADADSVFQMTETHAIQESPAETNSNDAPQEAMNP
ncbi:hypothetical protein FACS18948_3150 [Clostridia bacterium]|nr:hypothetical protein FACS18948_3150 [Clostridia bacterium]